MKRILLLAVLAVFVMMPLSSFAKTAISDSDMAALTAQDGVTINLDNFNIDDVQVDVQGWGDEDGFTGYVDDGWVGASIATTAGASGSFISLTGDLTIDVGTNAGVTAVRVGLPGISIDGSLTQILAFGTSAANLAANLAGGASVNRLGVAYMSGITLATSGYMIISAH